MNKVGESLWCTEPNGYVDPKLRMCAFKGSKDLEYQKSDEKNQLGLEEKDSFESMDGIEWGEDNLIPRTIPDFFREKSIRFGDQAAFKQKKSAANVCIMK